MERTNERTDIWHALLGLAIVAIVRRPVVSVASCLPACTYLPFCRATAARSATVLGGEGYPSGVPYCRVCAVAAHLSELFLEGCVLVQEILACARPCAQRVIPRPLDAATARERGGMIRDTVALEAVGRRVGATGLGSVACRQWGRAPEATVGVNVLRRMPVVADGFVYL